MRQVINMIADKNSKVKPNLIKAKINMRPVKSSTSGYSSDILALHFLHLPRSSK
jgi:hypothetical protein